MPTVLRFDGFSVVIYPADHIPAHVHVFGGGNEAVFNLNAPAASPDSENYGSRPGVRANSRRAE